MGKPLPTAEPMNGTVHMNLYAGGTEHFHLGVTLQSLIRSLPEADDWFDPGGLASGPAEVVHGRLRGE